MLLFLLGCRFLQGPPDRVLVVVDTLRADSLGIQGSGMESSPRLDAFAEGATRFSRAYACSSWTLPSVSSLLTGALPSGHRVVAKDELFGRLDPSFTTLAELWKGKGYATAAFVNNAFLAPEFGLNQGFDLFDYKGADLSTHRSAEETVDGALAFLESKDEPAFVMVHLMEPHNDYDAPAPHKGKLVQGRKASFPIPLGPNLTVAWMNGAAPPPSEADRQVLFAAYLEEVLAVDAAIGRLIDALPPDTVVVVTADHGEEFWEFGAFEHGHTVLAPVSRVPLLARAEGLDPGVQTGAVDCRAAWAIMAGEPLPAPGVAITEDVLYGRDQISIATAEARLVAYPSTHSVRSYAIDAEGRESAVEDTAALELGAQLSAARGGMESTEPALAADIGFDEVELLRELGYITPKE